MKKNSGIELCDKHKRKAVPGSFPKLINLPRNWLHQAVTYMDRGELSFRLCIELVEFIAVLALLRALFPSTDMLFISTVSLITVHTWNWITNGLFWAVIIFTFPNLRNPGINRTVDYLNSLQQRLSKKKCISGIAIYGSISRNIWHERSDIDIRFLRETGLYSLLCASWVTMTERFRAFINKQPMDLYLADNIDFLKKMRKDESPLLLLNRDSRLRSLYPDSKERSIRSEDLIDQNPSF